MPWILPGVPPTNRKVEVVVVSIVTLRGGRLYHEHVYWDQASVLVQVGLLDPKVVPEKAKSRGVTRLPVVGKDAARRILGKDLNDEEEGEADNDLIKGWANAANNDADGNSGHVEKEADDNANGPKKKEEPGGISGQDNDRSKDGTEDLDEARRESSEQEGADD